MNLHCDHYIGTKQLQAAPMNRIMYNNYRGWTLPEDENGLDEGYIVFYNDGHVSWSPKATFEAAYKNIRAIGLNISQALSLVECGVAHGMARKNWNGNGMYVVYQPGYPDGVPCNANTAKAFNLIEGSIVRVRPHLQLLTADGSIAEWSPSGSDVIEEDWMLVFSDEEYRAVVGM